MDFDLTKEQQQLGDSIQRFVAREYGFEKRKGILRSEAGMSREVWGHLAEMGLLALQIPEEHGGMGAAAIETMLAMNGIGRGLLLEPYLASAVVATTLLRDLGSPQQQSELFPSLAAGERIAVLAHTEPGTRYDPTQIPTRAARRPDPDLDARGAPLRWLRPERAQVRGRARAFRRPASRLRAHRSRPLRLP